MNPLHASSLPPGSPPHHEGRARLRFPVTAVVGSPKPRGDDVAVQPFMAAPELVVPETGHAEAAEVDRLMVRLQRTLLGFPGVTLVRRRIGQRPSPRGTVRTGCRDVGPVLHHGDATWGERPGGKGSARSFEVSSPFGGRLRPPSPRSAPSHRLLSWAAISSGGRPVLTAP